MRPPRPEPATSSAAMPFSARILRAAGLAGLVGAGLPPVPVRVLRRARAAGTRRGSGAGGGFGVDLGDQLTRR